MCHDSHLQALLAVGNQRLSGVLLGAKKIRCASNLGAVELILDPQQTRSSTIMNEMPPSQPSSSNHAGSIIGGIFLIGLGVIFFLQNMGWFYIGNWWALFILLGTAGAWGNALHTYHKNGQRITQPVIGNFIGGLFPLAIAMIFLFNLDWGMMWPVFLIIAGVAVLSKAFAVSN
jgi:hypothetical protein